jgi:hypothetical protein
LYTVARHVGLDRKDTASVSDAFVGKESRTLCRLSCVIQTKVQEAGPEEDGMTSAGDDIWKGMAAGALGGLAGSYAMNQFQSLWNKASETLSGESEQQESGEESEDATIKAAQAISRNLFGHELADSEKKWAGPIVHYSFGTAVGVLYGALSEAFPACGAGHGTVFGSGVWLVADETGVPAAGLSKPATEVPASSHIAALAAHLVYGFVADLVIRTTRARYRQA